MVFVCFETFRRAPSKKGWKEFVFEAEAEASFKAEHFSGCASFKAYNALPIHSHLNYFTKNKKSSKTV